MHGGYWYQKVHRELQSKVYVLDTIGRKSVTLLLLPYNIALEMTIERNYRSLYCYINMLKFDNLDSHYKVFVLNVLKVSLKLRQTVFFFLNLHIVH